MRPNTPSNKNRDAFSSGSNILAVAGSVVLTFFLAPLLYQVSVDAAIGFTDRNYGYGWGDWVAFLWGLGCALVTFGACQMLLAATFRLGIARLTAMLFRH